MKAVLVVLMVVVIVLFVWAALGCLNLMEETDALHPAVALISLSVFYLIIQSYGIYRLTASEKPLS